jgi:hypothetical protein
MAVVDAFARPSANALRLHAPQLPPAACGAAQGPTPALRPSCAALAAALPPLDSAAGQSHALNMTGA